MSHHAVPPGAIIGILGGGQLGRMLAMAAARIGYRCHVFEEDAHSPAAQVCEHATLASFRDRGALSAFAAAVDVATYEFENIPIDAARQVASRVPLRPSPSVLERCQDRIHEKDFLDKIGVPTTRYQPVATFSELRRAVTATGYPLVLKQARMGYDGKGQIMVPAASDLDAAWHAIASGHDNAAAIAEAWVDFSMEISVIVARSAAGQVVPYPPVQNIHKNHILKTTIAPAPIASSLATKSQEMAVHIAEQIDLVGVLAVEMFVVEGSRLLVNELAPRPHNSGHWTIDACTTSQFEQSVRAITGLPLGDPMPHAGAKMDNLLGDEVSTWPTLFAEKGAFVHLYGKQEIRPARKMGHVTRLQPWPTDRS